MRRATLELVVGLFLLLGIACLTWLAVRMGDLGTQARGRYEIQARFSSTSGLKTGAFVEVAGVRVGTVTDITFDPQEYAANVRMLVDDRVKLQEDTIASIRTSGIIGDKFVKITPGGSDVYLAPGETIVDTEPSISLEELISKYIFESGD